MSEAPPTRGRWSRFSLRTLFVAVTIFAVLTLWVRYNLQWIGQREEARAWLIANGYGCVDSQTTPTTPLAAPWSLRVLSEKGESYALLEKANIPEENLQLTARRMKQLFPEASINIFDKDKLITYVFNE